MEGNTRLLIARAAAFAFWLACVALVLVPLSNRSSGSSVHDMPSAAFHRPTEPPGPHPAIRLKE